MNDIVDEKSFIYLFKVEWENGFATRIVGFDENWISSANLKEVIDSVRELNKDEGRNPKILLVTSVSYLGEMSKSEWEEKNG